MLLSQLLFRVVIIGALALLSACSIYSLPGSEPVPVETEPDYTVVTPSPAPVEPYPRPADPAASAAYQPLLAKAREASARGDYEQALALLERAQRIDPDSAQIYMAMAQTHDARGDTTQARATAERGLLYCQDGAQCAALRAYTR